MNLKSGWSRRSFLSTFGAAIGTFFTTGKLQAAPLMGQSKDYGKASVHGTPRLTGLGSTGDIYAELGVTPVLNGAGTYTVLGGSLMAPEVIEVMRLGNDHFVDINELEVAAGKMMAQMCKMPAGYTGLVTAGAAAALLVGYAAILTGDNKQYIQQIPDLTGMPKSEVIIQKSHRYPFDHQVRQTGVKLVEVETREELIAAINPRTAALHFTNLFNEQGQVKVDEFVQIAHQHNLPAFNDCAADTPPIPRLWKYTNMGYDLVTFSGGKDIRGPQAAGLLMGKEELIRCSLLNMSPQEDTIGRASKVGKEEICGMLKALEMFLASDQDAILKQYYVQLGHISDKVKKIPSVTTAYDFNPNQIANHTVSMSISWDPAKILLTRKQVTEQLAASKPLSIRLAGGDGGGWKKGGAKPRPSVGITPWMLKPGEEKIIADRLSEILHSGIVTS
ncbi:MAG TPA: aminotransferase class V-fold PLP-dependent enzyme [Acidobacteriaceae bacterium]|jgi:L-seryl-tRNA(Ser) seleniumtransferase|nr:aminotransferase class V-fold PLP-dependent enzyme [Acidobacteriaceae bacterium]